MELIDVFTLQKHSGPYEGWPQETELLMYGKSTGTYIPGYVIEAQYQYTDGYLLVSSWDCLYEEAQTFISLSSELKLINHKTIGAAYASIWLESHEVVNEKSVLFHCDNDMDIVAVMTSSSHVKLTRQSRIKSRNNFADGGINFLNKLKKIFTL